MLDDKRIFVVEDDPTNLAIISTILRRHGATVLFDNWGSGTVEKLLDSRPIDIILLDLALPRGVSGYDIYDQIREEKALDEVPVVIVTAADPSMEMNKAREKGVNGFISKPISYGTFGRAVANVLEGREIWYDEDVY